MAGHHMRSSLVLHASVCSLLVTIRLHVVFLVRCIVSSTCMCMATLAYNRTGMLHALGGGRGARGTQVAVFVQGCPTGASKHVTYDPEHA